MSPVLSHVFYLLFMLCHFYAHVSLFSCVIWMWIWYKHYKKSTTVFITVGYSSTPYLFYLFDFIAECFTVPLFIKKKKQFSYVAVIEIRSSFDSEGAMKIWSEKERESARECDGSSAKCAMSETNVGPGGVG